METPQIGVTPNSPYSLVGATFGGMIGQQAGGVQDAQKILAQQYGYTGPQDGVLTNDFLNALYSAQNQQQQAGIAAMGQQGFTDYQRNSLRGGQNTAPGQTPSIGTAAAAANIPSPTSTPTATPAPIPGQLNALNTTTQSATPTTDNGVGNSTSGSQLLPGQTSASLGNISNQMTPQEQQRQAIGTDPNNITGYQDTSKI